MLSSKPATPPSRALSAHARSPHRPLQGRAPRQTAADGGYASHTNLTAAKARGVADVAFHKKCGIAIADMVKSPWVYRRLRNYRAGIEAGISGFKRAYGAARCTCAGSTTQGLHLVGGGGPQPGAARPPQPGLASPAAAGDSAAGQSTRPTLLAIRFPRPVPLLPRAIAPAPARTAPPPALLRH